MLGSHGWHFCIHEATPMSAGYKLLNKLTKKTGWETWNDSPGLHQRGRQTGWPVYQLLYHGLWRQFDLKNCCRLFKWAQKCVVLLCVYGCHADCSFSIEVACPPHGSLRTVLTLLHFSYPKKSTKKSQTNCVHKGTGPGGLCTKMPKSKYFWNIKFF